MNPDPDKAYDAMREDRATMCLENEPDPGDELMHEEDVFDRDECLVIPKPERV